MRTPGKPRPGDHMLWFRRAWFGLIGFGVFIVAPCYFISAYNRTDTPKAEVKQLPRLPSLLQSATLGDQGVVSTVKKSTNNPAPSNHR
ncbi:MAG: hypothetical protein ABI443_08855 [Chthoniobacterales bacterium]